MGKTVLILGGGVGGLVAANKLRSWLAGEHEVTLVDRQASFAFAPSFLWVMTGSRTAQKISRPLARLERRGIEVVRGEVESIEPFSRGVIVDGRSLEADYLVIALGAELAPELVPGLSQAGHDLYSLEGALSLREALSHFAGGRLVLLTAAPGYKCPAAPYEAAMLIEHECRRRGVRGQTEIELYSAEPAPMGVAGPEVSESVVRMLGEKGIRYHPGQQIQTVEAGRRLRFAGGLEAAFDLLAYVPPHRAPEVVREAGLTDESGWISVDRHTLQTRFPDVWALGDVVSIPLKLGKPLPRAGVFAHREAEVVARNIRRAISGKGRQAAFDGRGQCFIEAGSGKAGLGHGSFYAEPLPEVRLHRPARRWHLAKVFYEKEWLGRWL
ncbi:MAG: NAD(P)/FAD-dependent oxidoreductase [Myxococcales bacterium]|nr:NAD(P)/FAD-dependent oxidoreductase [Myxococcales bacterium]